MFLSCQINHYFSSFQVQGLIQELGCIQKSRKTASGGLRLALQKAAQTRLMEEKNKGPSCAMRISVKINKVVWSMLADGKTFAEAEINDMVSKLFCWVSCYIYWKFVEL